MAVAGTKDRRGDGRPSSRVRPKDAVRVAAVLRKQQAVAAPLALLFLNNKRHNVVDKNSPQGEQRMNAAPVVPPNKGFRSMMKYGQGSSHSLLLTRNGVEV